MNHESQVELLLEELANSDATPEIVCLGHPELLAVVTERWQHIRRVQVELDAMFPSSSALLQQSAHGAALPQMPGYDVVEVLGQGGMGIVYKARHLKLNRLVAVKMLLSGIFASQTELERFTREAKAEALLSHPHIVQVYDVGEISGRPYFTMEFVGGGTLAKRLAGIPLDAMNAAEMVATLADAVDFAHRNGIVHRDLKPANILLTTEGLLKISDFGLAQHLNAETQLTFQGDRIGTPSYMPPEQALGQVDRIGPASDVYALGAILYELLTGRPPFRANSVAETERQLISEDPVPPAALNSQVPRALETVCLMCLRKDPARRYPSAAELSADLRRFLRHEPVAARPIGPIGRLNHWARRNPGLSVSLLAAAVLLLIVAAGSLASTLHFRELRIKDQSVSLKMRKLAEDALGAQVLAEGLYEQAEERGAALRVSLYSAEMKLCGEAANSPGGISRIHDWLIRWKDSKPDLRGWEWYYLYGLCHRDLETLSVTDAGLWCVAASPDGQQLAVSGNDPVICVFDVKSRNLVHRLQGHKTSVSSVAWSTNGLQLASACWDGSIKTWDTRTAREVRTFHNQTDPLYSVAWDRDGKRLAAAGERGPVWVWDATTGKLVDQLEGHTPGVRGIAWHPGENRIASAGMDSNIYIWDVNDPKHPKVLNDHGNWVNKVAWHPDGSRLASVSNDHTCKIWNTGDGTVVSTLVGHREGILDVGWSGDGRKLATCSEDQTIRIWNVHDGKIRTTFQGHTGKVTSVNWCDRDEQLISSSHDGTVKFWSAATADETPHLDVNGFVSNLAWSPNGLHIAKSTGDGPVKLLDPTHRKPPIVVGETLPSVFASWAPNGKLLASCGFDQIVHVWNVETGAEVRTLSGKGQQIHTLAWSHHSSTLAAVDGGGNVYLWKTDSGDLLRTLGDQQAYCFAVAWSPDDHHLATAWNNGTVRCYDVKSGDQIWNVFLHPESAVGVAWSSDGKSIASAGGDGMVHICDAATGDKKNTLKGHSGAVMKIAWHPDGSRLATASSDHSVRIWNPLTGILMLSFLEPSFPMRTVAWSPDGKSLAAAGEGGPIVIYDATAGFKAAGSGSRRPALLSTDPIR